MKTIAKPAFYFSAYPLKVIKEQDAPNKQPSSPYLRALLTGKTKSKPNNGTKARVYSLVNTNQVKQKPPTKEDKNKLPKDIELTEKGWFKNYE